MPFCRNCDHFDYEHEDVRPGEPCGAEDFGSFSFGFVSLGACDCPGYEPEVIG